MVYFFVGLALIALGVTMLAKPQLIFELTESWKHSGGVDEPSKLYLWNTRLGGVVFILGGLCGLAVPFLS